MRLKNIILIGCIIILGCLYYFYIDDFSFEKQEFKVVDVIDGDTFLLENNIYCRMKGINTPEKNMPYYNFSKNFLESQIKDKIIEIENFGTDMYGRLLVYAFVSDKNLNELVLKNGLGHFYPYDDENDKYFSLLENAEKFARENKLGIWQDSKYKNCVELKEFDYVSDGGEKIVLNNNCDFDINVILKDEATHIYFETLQKNKEGVFEFEHIFNDAGDSLFVWDDEGKLLIFERY